MPQRLIATILAVALLLTFASARIAPAAERPASTHPSGAAAATSQPVELGALDGTAVLVRIGAVIDGVMLDKLGLSDDVKARARQALRAWYLNDLAASRQRLQAELPTAGDARRAQLLEAIKDYSTPYRSAQTLRSYVGAKAALKDILTAEQLGKLDALVRAATTDMVVNHYILAIVAGWKKDNVVLAGDQQARLDTILASAKSDSVSLAAGDEFGLRKIVNRLSADLPRILTPEQRVQIMHPTP